MEDLKIALAVLQAQRGELNEKIMNQATQLGESEDRLRWISQEIVDTQTEILNIMLEKGE
jgi:hypothetical protein